MNHADDQDLLRVLRLLAERCPRLVRQCYWAGTSAAAIEELHHRRSFDLDFHTRQALADVRPILAEIQQAFPGAFEVLRAPDSFGSGFSGLLTLPQGPGVAVEVLANYEAVADTDLRPSSIPAISRVALERYLADKIQCVAERAEARDLVDILAVLRRRPDLVPLARQRLAEQDALLVAERLQTWTDEALREDLAAYEDITPADAAAARDMLLSWLKELERDRL